MIVMYAVVTRSSRYVLMRTSEVGHGAMVQCHFSPLVVSFLVSQCLEDKLKSR